MISYQVKGGIAIITWDMPGRSANVLNEESILAFSAAALDAADDPKVHGIIITSAKNDFIAGADLSMLQRFADGEVDPPDSFYWFALNGEGLNTALRRLETCGKPVVAAINGSALGGGMEVCLGCHRRIVADRPSISLGLPEATLGLLPAGGGTQRLGRLLGWQKSADLLLTGRRLSPDDALAAGLVDEIVPASGLIKAARAWIQHNPSPRQPWDEKDFRLPGGDIYERGNAAAFNQLITQVHISTQGNAPAQLAILRCLHDGLRASFEAGLRIEVREVYALLKHPAAGNMIRSLFFSLQKARKLDSRPKDVKTRKFAKVGVLGAGMMGAGIALVTARAGIPVILLDRSRGAVEKGKLYSDKVLSRAVECGSISAAEKASILNRILPTIEYTDLDGCDLVIEAVFEDRAVKADVTAKAEAIIRADAVFGSNTSTLPITGLAEKSERPPQFIGIHFFSPVDRMPLVEVICGRQTSEVTLAHTLDFVSQIGMTPIIVKDSRGFYTSRVFGTYSREGVAMLSEGVPPALIENLGRATGMPVPPLALLDEISLDLVLHVRRQTESDLGPDFVREPIDDVVGEMVQKLDRPGRKAGRGFYDYTASGKRLWPQLATLFPVATKAPDNEDLKKRFLYIQAIEAARCVEEGVITNPGNADIGAILGWGFPSYTGGPLSLIDTVGVAAFVAECEVLATRYGARFSPPRLLHEMAARNERFHPRAAVAKPQSSA